MRFGHYYRVACGPHTGVVDAIAKWAGALHDVGHDVRILHGGGDQTDRFANAELRAVRHIGAGRATAVPRGFASALDGVDVLVLHEGWTTDNAVAAAFARSRRVPFVVVPHGVFEPRWVATLRAPRAARAAVERRTLRAALAAHVFFERERADVRRFAPALPAVVAPTGFDLAETEWSPGGDALVWLGRYSIAHKGIDLLVRAIERIPRSSRPRLVLRGVDDTGRAEIAALVDELGLTKWVQVGGPVWGAEKEDLMRGALGYVHPARWDCHPGVLADALAMGVPTLVSDRIYAAPELSKAGAVRVSSLDVDDLARAIAGLLDSDPRRLTTAAREFVATEWSWRTVMPRYLSGIADALDTRNAQRAR